MTLGPHHFILSYELSIVSDASAVWEGVSTCGHMASPYAIPLGPCNSSPNILNSGGPKKEGQDPLPRRPTLLT